jgi:hypothetical protein
MSTTAESLPRPRQAVRHHHPAKAVLTGLATAARFAGHFAVAAVSVAVVGVATEH